MAAREDLRLSRERASVRPAEPRMGSGGPGGHKSVVGAVGPERAKERVGGGGPGVKRSRVGDGDPSRV